MMNKPDNNRRSSPAWAKPMIWCLLLVVLALSVSACGRKNDPTHPEGATYPEDYPTE